jgi:hypothetical protein
LPSTAVKWKDIIYSETSGVIRMNWNHGGQICLYMAVLVVALRKWKVPLPMPQVSRTVLLWGQYSLDIGIFTHTDLQGYPTLGHSGCSFLTILLPFFVMLLVNIISLKIAIILP